tara:strand:- start:233 stop:646 length:414 start_codon:yes stop_codon:yes gene_type:complete
MLNKIIGAMVGAILITMSTFAVAEHEGANPMPDIPKDYQPAPEIGNQLYWLQMPVICGTSENVLAYLERNHFTLVNVSVGRDRAKPDGEPVFIVQYYVDPTYKQSVVVMTTMSGLESCMLYKSFDLEFVKPKIGLNL